MQPPSRKPAKLWKIWSIMGAIFLCPVLFTIPTALPVFLGGLTLYSGTLLFFWCLLTNLSIERRPELRRVCLSFLPFPICLWLSFHLRASQERASIEVGNTIIAALHHYHADHRKYPNSLSMLVPNYLPEVPRTKMRLERDEYVYGHGPYLSFQYFPWKNSMYRYYQGRWEKGEN